MGSTATSFGSGAGAVTAALDGASSSATGQVRDASNVRTFSISPRPVSGETKWGCEVLSQAPTRKPTAPARSKIS